MAKFKITETRNAIQTWIYEIEADTRAEALEMIVYNKVKPIDHMITDQDDNIYLDVNEEEE